MSVTERGLSLPSTSSPRLDSVLPCPRGDWGLLGRVSPRATRSEMPTLFPLILSIYSLPRSPSCTPDIYLMQPGNAAAVKARPTRGAAEAATGTTFRCQSAVTGL